MRRQASPRAIARLHEATRRGAVDEIKELLKSKEVHVDARDSEGATPLCRACESGHLPVVQALSAHGARRASVRDGAGGLFAEEAAEHHADVLTWLQRSRAWVTALHHSPVLEEADVLELLRSGADLHARRYGMCNAPSPLDVAVQMGEGCAASQLIIQASQPWSPKTHHLFPQAARARAVELMRIGHQLAATFATEAPGGLLDAWLFIIQLSVRRGR